MAFIVCRVPQSIDYARQPVCAELLLKIAIVIFDAAHAMKLRDDCPRTIALGFKPSSIIAPHVGPSRFEGHNIRAFGFSIQGLVQSSFSAQSRVRSPPIADSRIA